MAQLVQYVTHKMTRSKFQTFILFTPGEDSHFCGIFFKNWLVATTMASFEPPFNLRVFRVPKFDGILRRYIHPGLGCYFVGSRLRIFYV